MTCPTIVTAESQDLIISRRASVMPQSRNVSTSLMTEGWRPATPWLAMTAIISAADEVHRTRYIAIVMHPDKTSRDRRKAMGPFCRLE